MNITDKILSAWIDESLSPEKMNAVSAAVQADPALQTRAEALRSIGAAMRQESVEIPVSAERMVADVRRAIRLQDSPAPRRVLPWAWAGATACACLLIAALFLLPAHKDGVAIAQAEIEYVDSELPGASPMVYTDYEAGWTVVWLDGVELEPGS